MSLIPFRKSTSPDRIDEDLRLYAAEGDAEAFRQLVERHLPTVQQAAARVLGRGSAWQDDVAQDVFLQLARKAPRLPADTVVCAWLHRQAVRRAIDIIRAEDRRRLREAQADVHPNHDSHGDDSPWSAIAPRLDGELLRLPRQDQEVLALRFMERCSSEEAARRLGLTSAVVRKRIERALGKLRRRLAGPVPGALTVTALAAYLSVPTAKAAPAAKVAAITGHCLATPAAPFLLSSSTLAIMTKTQLLCTAGAVVTLGAGILVAYRHNTTGGTSAGYSPNGHSSSAAANTGANRPPNGRKVPGGDTFPATKEGRMAMLLSIVSRIDATERTLALDRFLSRLDTAELPEMLAHLCSQRFSSEAERQAFVSAQEMMLTAWTKVDPRAALESATDPSRPYAGVMGPQAELQTIAGIWAVRDADAAIAWAKARPPVPAETWGEDPFMVGLIRTISAQDRQKATALLVEMPYGLGRRAALSGMISDVFASGRDDAAAWIDTLADERLRKGANNMIADRLADEDPRASVDWIITRMGGDTDNTSIDTIMKRWLGKNQEDALAGFDSIPEGRVRTDAFATIAMQLYRQNPPPEAADWIIDRLTSGSIPGSVEDWVYKRWVQRDPAAALDHWQTLPDHMAIPASRRVIDNLAAKDISQATAFYLENLPRVNPYNTDDLLEKMNNAAADTFVDEISRRDPAAWRKVIETWMIADAPRARAHCDARGIQPDRLQAGK